MSPNDPFASPSELLYWPAMLETQTGPRTRENQPAPRKESRSMERFSLRLPTRISPLEPGNPILDVITENICAGGAFFQTRKPLPEGLKVQVEVTLRLDGASRASRAQVKGEVLGPRPDGMAIRFEKRVHISPLG